ncbi:MAG TPA: hypothetical protein VGJ94_11605 [Syntrophorhabdaceae bacterium]|jgi:hypothetical protein
MKVLIAAVIAFTLMAGCAIVPLGPYYGHHRGYYGYHGGGHGHGYYR